jgi:hypothetical protein
MKAKILAVAVAILSEGVGAVRVSAHEGHAVRPS